MGLVRMDRQTNAGNAEITVAPLSSLCSGEDQDGEIPGSRVRAAWGQHPLDPDPASGGVSPALRLWGVGEAPRRDLPTWAMGT